MIGKVHVRFFSSGWSGSFVVTTNYAMYLQNRIAYPAQILLKFQQDQGWSDCISFDTQVPGL